MKRKKFWFKSLDYLPLDDVVPPDETNIVRVIFEDALLNPGQYWLHVEASKDGEVLYSERLRQVITEKCHASCGIRGSFRKACIAQNP